MRLLLDTHFFLWAAASSKRLPREARELLEDDDNEVCYSAASIWEIAIKSSLGRKDFRIDYLGDPCSATLGRRIRRDRIWYASNCLDNPQRRGAGC